MSEKGRPAVNPSSLAADLVADARRIQQECGKQITGPLGLDRTELSRISKTAQSIPLIRNMPSPLADATLALLERFEELCRRRAVDIPDRLHEPVYEHLAKELSANHQALGGIPRHLVAVTLHHGNVSDLMTDPEFARWQKVPSLLRHAAKRHPSDPWGFLRQAEKVLAQLMADPELAPWHGVSGVLQRAVIFRPQAPRSFLLKAIQVAGELAEDPRFEIWRDSPEVYRQIALSHPSDPQTFLLQATEQVKELKNDPELAFWHSSPWVYKRAVLNHPHDAKKHLLRAAATTQVLQHQASRTELRSRGLKARYAAMTSPHVAQQTLHPPTSGSKTTTVPEIPGVLPRKLPGELPEAREYLAELRQLQKQCSTGLVGTNPLMNRDYQAIASGLAASKSCQRLPKGIAEILAQRLEIMAVRRELPVPEDFRGAVYDVIAEEFQANLAAYGGAPNRLVSVTIYQGEVAGLLSDGEFARFRHVPGMMAWAVRGKPRDPQGALRRAGAEIDRLKADPRFALLLSSPSVFSHAVSGHPKNPDQFLLDVIQVTQRLKLDPRFSELQDSPGIFSYVALRYRQSPEVFLERVIETIHRLQANPRFACFQNTPWVFRRVALSCPSQPEKALQKASDALDELRKDQRFAEFADNPGFLTDAVFKHSGNPKQFLCETQETIVQLKNDSRLKRFQAYPWAYVYAATRYRLGAAEALLRVAKQIDRLTADPRLASLRNCPCIFTRTALYRPHTCEALLLQAVHDPSLREKLIDGNAQAGEDEDNEP